jgi:hypothetical protein
MRAALVLAMEQSPVPAMEQSLVPAIGQAMRQVPVPSLEMVQNQRQQPERYSRTWSHKSQALSPQQISNTGSRTENYIQEPHRSPRTLSSPLRRNPDF